MVFGLWHIYWLTDWLTHRKVVQYFAEAESAISEFLICTLLIFGFEPWKEMLCLGMWLQLQLFCFFFMRSFDLINTRVHTPLTDLSVCLSWLLKSPVQVLACFIIFRQDGLPVSCPASFYPHILLRRGVIHHHHLCTVRQTLFCFLEQMCQMSYIILLSTTQTPL